MILRLVSFVSVTVNSAIEATLLNMWATWMIYIYIYIYTAKYNKKTNVYRNKYTHWQMAFICICIFIFFIYSMRWYSLLTKWSWKLSSQVLKGSCKHASYLRRNDIIILHNVSNCQVEWNSHFIALYVLDLDEWSFWLPTRAMT